MEKNNKEINNPKISIDSSPYNLNSFPFGIPKIVDDNALPTVEEILAHPLMNNPISIIKSSSTLFTPSDELLKLQSEISSLEQDVSEMSRRLLKVQKAKKNEILEIENKMKLLVKKQQIIHIASRISDKAESKLLEEESMFANEFRDARECEAVVISIDIRRSTELMLKARTPKMYSDFITGLSKKLSKCIKDNLGVFDKFTGDGVLAFFPIFYSGEDAIISALHAANQCHKIFLDHYNESKHHFTVFIKNIGLGIGIDYGQVTIVNSNSELTVVGIPVVYACRFSGAKAGETLLNSAAYEQILSRCPDKIKVTEKEIEIKNEGIAGAYSVELNALAFSHITPPLWMSEDTKVETETGDVQVDNH